MNSGPGSFCLRWVHCGLSALALAGLLVRAQEPAPPPDAAPGPPTTVHGVVLNAATGQPLPRALVMLQGEQQLGALTDGDGRFSIPAVPSGLQSLDVTKPNFHSPGPEMYGPLGHLVRVTADTPELSFALAPDNAISGHVSLSTGLPAEGIGVVLLRQVSLTGRAVWSQSSQQQTSPDGAFRFHGLADDAYLVMTTPEFENIRELKATCNADAPAVMDGYGSIFYGGSESLATASRIVVTGGQNAEINIALNKTRFYMVQVSMPHLPNPEAWSFSNALFEHSGQASPYPIQEEKNHTLCAYLPDGVYTLTEDVSPNAPAQQRPAPGQRPGTLTSPDRAGVLEFAVDGHAVRNLQMPLSQAASTPVYVHFQPGPPKPRDPSTQSQRDGSPLEEGPEQLLNLGGSQSNAISDNSNNIEAEPVNETTYSIGPSAPGAYWIQATSSSGTCLGDVTAAGQDLAQSPWIVGASGTGTPIDVVLRTDCATLTLQMPAALAEESPGEGARLFVYAVPELSSVEGVSVEQLLQFGQRSTKMESLTPGAYRVFAFRTPRSLEFRNPAALAQAGAGQEVTLEPGGSATLVVQETSQ